jgi:hypothetical protein
MGSVEARCAVHYMGHLEIGIVKSGIARVIFDMGLFGKTLISALTALTAVDSNVHGVNAAHDAA